MNHRKWLIQTILNQLNPAKTHTNASLEASSTKRLHRIIETALTPTVQIEQQVEGGVLYYEIRTSHDAPVRILLHTVDLDDQAENPVSAHHSDEIHIQSHTVKALELFHQDLIHRYPTENHEKRLNDHDPS